MPVRLDHTGWIPDSIRADLARHEDEFIRARGAEDIEDEPWCAELANEMQRIAERRDVVAFHCCREAEPDEIVSRGLRVLEGNGDAHRAQFLTRFGDRFTPEQRGQMQRKFLEVWGDGRYARGRENKLCFAFAHPRHWGPGCEDLLNFYGGESIYRTFGRDGPIADKLRSIGAPAVVHFRIPVGTVQTWMGALFAGRTALWAWHRRLRGDICGYWAEGYSYKSVAPENVLKVEQWAPAPPRRRAPRRPAVEPTGLSVALRYSYQVEKFSLARSCLMPSKSPGADAIAAAFFACTHAFEDMEEKDFENGLDDRARSLVATIKRFMDTSGIVDPRGKGTWTVKARSLTVDEQRELFGAVNELSAWFRCRSDL